MIDTYLNRRYDYDQFNCGHFVSEVYYDLTNINISDITSSFIKRNAKEFRRFLRDRVRLEKVDPICLMLMQDDILETHVGVVVEPEKVLHLTENGPICEHINNLKSLYSKVTFYK